MDFSSVKKWFAFFAGILCAILIADALATTIVAMAGISGWVKFLVSFIMYAVLFFAVLYVLEKLFGIEFFGFRREQKR